MAPGHMCRSNPETFFWWILRYIDSPGQIAKLNFKTVKYMEHPTEHPDISNTEIPALIYQWDVRDRFG